MLLLALDTSSPAVTVAVHDGDARWSPQRHRARRAAHGELLAPTIERALRDAGAAPADLTASPSGSGRDRSPGCGSVS